MRDVKSILADMEAGRLSADAAEKEIRACFFENLGHTTLDHDRSARTGSGEVVYGAGKSAAQLDDIFNHMVSRGSNVLMTRIDADKAASLKALDKGATYHPQGRLVTYITEPAPPAVHSVAVVSAGTSDMGVCEEAAGTLEFFGNPVTRIYDIGVAGLHRLLARLPEIRAARVVIVIAGMEGALPSVVGGLVDKPVIAVPTSVGYGASFNGLSALLGMLNSCASGLAVVNIDNGFGAAHLANRINRL
ncbi:MAG: nickel pincer cofactor biosynthesis protein LarB [Gammaproteobacteria bacterium]|nr:nickel pincer cofactor biosynthesis protein LarB [Gammaproteobacteria bacterium]